MGPRSIDRGIKCLELAQVALGPLQWGRDQLIAELGDWSGLAFVTTGLQWGRDQLIAELNRVGGVY